MYYMGFYAEISGVEPLNVNFRSTERQPPNQKAGKKQPCTCIKRFHMFTF